MNELMKQYGIDEVFYKRYIQENARQRLGMEMHKFLFFKEGRFINPMKKNEILQTYCEEEADNFYNKGIFNIPQIEFCITTKCTLKCKDCCALIPSFNSSCHIDMSFDDFKFYLDNILDDNGGGNVNMIRHFVILGGETLLNPHLPKMIDYACKQTKIFIVQVISNGTMKLKDELLQSLKANNKKCYVSLSDYSINEDLKRILKYDEIKEMLKENEIKFQMAENKEWVSEKGFAKEKSSDEMTRHKIRECFRSQCNCVMNGKLDICSKAAGARELGLLELRDYVDLVKSKNLKEDLVKFYQNDIYDACAYCILSDEKIQPAIQEGSKNG